MGVIYCGIDEAGYGPMLGPLCVAMTAFRVRDWAAGDPAPDLWEMLSPAVCRTVKEARSGALAVGDSKKLKGANSLKTRHPLLHLERGVLAFAQAGGHEVADDAGLFELVGARLEDEAWCGGEAAGLPVGERTEAVGIAANVLKREMARAGVEVVSMRCRVVGVGEFNRVLGETGSKAATTLMAVREHLASVRARWGDDEAVRVVCDRQSGRSDYSGVVRAGWGDEASELERTARASRYALGERGAVQFVPEAEGAHLPVALASMVAKYVRELAMARFNRYWSARVQDLKPTAGYVQDARRWLDDVRDAVLADERRAMVRNA